MRCAQKKKTSKSQKKYRAKYVKRVKYISAQNIIIHFSSKKKRTVLLSACQLQTLVISKTGPLVDFHAPHRLLESGVHHMSCHHSKVIKIPSIYLTNIVFLLLERGLHESIFSHSSGLSKGNSIKKKLI